MKNEKIRLEKQKRKEQIRVDGIKRNYINTMRDNMSNYQKYPLISKARKEQGTVEIAFRVSKTGAITNIRIKKSSGYKRLDKAALKIFRRMGTGYEIPDDIKEEFMDIVLPITYKLK